VADEPYDRPGDPYGGDYEIFETMAGMGQDLNLWLGDNVYYREVDWWSPEGLAYRNRHDRALPELQQLLATAPNYAIWDDHDYGPNNSDRSYILKGAALDLFTQFWPNPTYGLPDTPGIFYNFLYADVEFFMLDNRYYRTPNNAPEDPNDDTVLGEAQLQWLLDALQASYAPFKVVAMGGQFLNPNEVFETYINLAPAERQYLLDELERRDIRGVIFLSGDRHHTELNRMDREGAYPLYEFTSSPLTSGAATAPRDSTNAYRVDGTLVTQRNFGTMTVEGERTDRVMTLRTFSTSGDLLWEHRIRANDLRPPR
jgi:alkaline phosphatase D